MKIKIFDYAQRLDLFAAEQNKIESIVNDWLAQNPKVVIKDIKLGSAMLPTADEQASNYESFCTLTQLVVLYEEIA